MQQQLAKLQISLEKTHDKFVSAQDSRTSAESSLTGASVLYQQKHREREIIVSRREECQRELDKLNATLRQVEMYNLELKSDIMVTRRAAYGTEEQVQSLEKETKMQDFHIDRLNEQLKRATDELELYDSQLSSQKEATAAAVEMMRQASTEMEAIAAEKRDYLQRWKSSLHGMARRDAALQAADAAVERQQEKIRSLEMEVVGLKNSNRKEQETNEKLTAILQRVEAETKFLESQVAAVAEQRQRLNEQYVLLRNALEESDKDLSGVQAEQRKLQAAVDQLVKKRELIIRKQQALDENVAESLNDQTTLEKGAQNVAKSTHKLQQQIREKEMQVGEVQNELARIRVDSLNTEAHNKELKQTVDEFERELQEKAKLIEKYEQEIRQRHDAIEKKQIYILRLNRKYDSLVANKEEVNTGPLEATIKNVSKEMGSLEKESTELQRQWIKAQMELVALTSEIGEREEKIAELRSRQTVMTQKRMRSENAIGQQKREILGLEKEIRNMHTGFAKLSELVSKNVALQNELSNAAYNMESEFVEKLKMLEEQSLKTQGGIEALKREKQRLFDEVIEAERQIMLWEKKIQLEKETQAALDNEYGQPEIRAMKKEIHRMELRMAQLRKEQERLVLEMERTISKQESIKLA